MTFPNTDRARISQSLDEVFQQDLELQKILSAGASVQGERKRLDDSSAMPWELSRENAHLRGIGFGLEEITISEVAGVRACFVAENAASNLKTEEAEHERFMRYWNEVRNRKPDIGNIFFYGGNGCGKTTCLSLIARAFYRAHYDPRYGISHVRMKFVKCWRMLEDLAAHGCEDDSVYLTVPILFLDDIDRDYTGHRRALFQGVMDERKRNWPKLWTGQTSALNAEVEYPKLYPHDYSRTTGSKHHVFVLQDYDFR